MPWFFSFYDLFQTEAPRTDPPHSPSPALCCYLHVVLHAMYGHQACSSAGVVLGFRLVPPWSRSGDWFYQLSEVVALVLTSGAFLLTWKSHSSTYDRRMDSFGGSRFLPNEFAVLWIIVPALLLALVRAVGVWTCAVCGGVRSHGLSFPICPIPRHSPPRFCTLTSTTSSLRTLLGRSPFTSRRWL